MAKQQSTEEVLTGELIKFIEPLTSRLTGGPEGLIALLEDVGLGELLLDAEVSKLQTTVVEDFSEPLMSIGSTLSTLEGSDGLETINDIDQLIEDTTAVAQGVQTFNDLEFQHPDVQRAGDIVLDYFLVSYLETYHPDVNAALRGCGIVTTTDAGFDRFELGKVGNLVSDPNRLARETLGWGSEEFDGLSVVIYVEMILERRDVVATIDTPTVQEVVAVHNEGDSQPTGGSVTPQQLYGQLRDIDGPPDLPDSLYISLSDSIPGLTGVELGVKILPAPPYKNERPGLAFVPVGEFTRSNSWDVSEELSLELKVGGSVTDTAFIVRPDGNGGVSTTTVSLDGSPGPGQAKAEAELTYEPESPDATILLGEPDATRFSVESASIGGGFTYEDSEFEFQVELPASGTFVIKPEGGFLSMVLPDQIRFDFDATVGWSSVEGLYFEGGGTLEASIPTHASIGPVDLNELYLALPLDEEDADLGIEAATSPSLSLGPISATVKRIGIEADLTFRNGGDGNLGPVDMALDFRAPDGIGLGVDTGPAAGSGYLEFHPEQHRYTGTFQLQVGDLSLTVVGLLKTKLPDTDGYSLLLLVTAELPPIRLGFGFTLNGIGGLVGIHRGLRRKPLGKAVRTGNLDSVLFPDDVAENATQIISDLRSIFPPKADFHVFGPMIRLAWGSPAAILRADIGVVLSIPAFKIALLGKFMLDLPDEEAALIDLNLAVVGFLDIPNKKVAIDASLYDSSIVLWDVSGDMALRATWGEKGRFLLSVGGFNERYKPPKSFPELDPIVASLSPPNGNPRLEYTGYLAVTPNSFQVGAGVVLHGEFGPATVHGELSFDALFRFAPFSFVVDFFAKLLFSLKGREMGIEVDGTLKGPKPWRIKGKVSIEVLFVSVTVKVNATLGSKQQKTELPTATILPKLREALGTPGNWSAQRPDSNSPIVSLRDPGGDGDGDDGADRSTGGDSKPVLAHPLGTLSVRQQVVPLGIRIEKFGNAEPKRDRFDLASFAVVDEGSDSTRSLPGDEELRERFSPGKFREMSDSEKLQSEDFERLPAGREIENGLLTYYGQDDAGKILWSTLDFEATVIDATNSEYRTSKDDWTTTLPDSTAHELSRTSRVAKGELHTTGHARYGGPDKSVSLDEEGYVVVDAADLTRIRAAMGGEPALTHVEAKDARDEYLDVNPEASVRVVARHEENTGGQA
jgi:hypothetical protein